MKAGLYMGTLKEGHPPLFAERQVPSTLIIFRTKKVEKSSPQENIIFRTKNTEKSQLAFGWKKFRKIFAGKCFGGSESPQSWGKGARC